MMPLRFSMAGPLMEPSERARLIATAKTLQERFDKYLAEPCLPELLAMMASMPPTAGGADPEDTPASQPATPHAEMNETPTAPWCCAFNNLGVLESRLRVPRGAIAVERFCIGNRLRNFMYGAFRGCHRVHVVFGPVF